MSYINVNTALTRNRKFRKFKRFLKIEDIEATGYLVSLWVNVLELAEDGEITKWTKEDIAEYAGFVGEPEKFYEALRLNGDGFIDVRKNRVFIHDWWDYAGKYLTTKYRTHNLEKLDYIKSLYRSDRGQTKVRLRSDKIREDKIDKNTLEIVRGCYLTKKGWKETSLHPDDYGRIHRAIKILYVKSNKNIDSICQAIEWVSIQGYCDWTMETVIKKWPDFIKRQEAALVKLRQTQNTTEKFEQMRKEALKEGLIPKGKLDDLIKGVLKKKEE